jgi:glyoxylase-like metal-dependent hydrolase (beta-lactamase superfamily II)
MWIMEPQKINDSIEYLGAREMCVYLLKGREYMLIEGGMSYIVPTLLRQLDERGIDPRRITKYLILHSHFDHCGAVPPLQKKFPWIEAVASHRTEELYAKEKVVKFIREMNDQMLKSHGTERFSGEVDLDIHELRVDIAVGEGDVIDLGEGVRVEIIEVPGHSSCSIAGYALPCRALFASDAGGIPNNEDVIYPSGNEDFILYQRSLKKMSEYPVEIHCAARYGAYTDDEGRDYIGRSIKAAEDFRLRVIDAVKREGDMEKVAIKFADEHYATSGTSDVPPDIMRALLRRMVSVIMEDHERMSQA